MEPKFLDDESLVDNLDEEFGQRIIKWLITVFESHPEDIDHAVYLAKAINAFFKPECACVSQLFHLTTFDKLLSQLEERYAEPQ